ncbi:MAG: rhodanese-like domain-containing protein [Puniceicoccaceae bacterium]
MTPSFEYQDERIPFQFCRRILLRGFWLAVVSGLLSAFVWGIHGSSAFARFAEAKEGEVTFSQIQAWAQEILWVDARQKSDWDAGRIENAVWLSEGNFESGLSLFLDRWYPGLAVVVYCDAQDCDASTAVAARLRDELEIDNVWVLKGGWQAWIGVREF